MNDSPIQLRTYNKQDNKLFAKRHCFAFIKNNGEKKHKKTKI